MTKYYTDDEIREGLSVARAADPGSNIRFKIERWGQLYAKMGDTTIMVCFPTSKGFSFPVRVGWDEANSFDELYKLIKEALRLRVKVEAADIEVVAELHLIERRVLGNCRTIYRFDRPISEAEFDAFGRRNRLQPFISPCGYVHREADNAFLVDESTD